MAQGAPPACIHEPAAQAHIRTGVPRLEEVLAQPSTHSSQPGAGAMQAPHRAAGAIQAVLCSAGGCPRRAAAGCLTRCCAAHCGDALCRGCH